jgi:hypothetical protein
MYVRRHVLSEQLVSCSKMDPVTIANLPTRCGSLANSCLRRQQKPAQLWMRETIPAPNQKLSVGSRKDAHPLCWFSAFGWALG